MTVTLAKNVLIKPIFRDPQDNRPHALIARFIGRTALTGDASGGDYVLNWNIGNLGSVYGAHTLFDIQSMTANVGALASSFAMTWLITVYSYELAQDGGGYTETYGEQSGIAYINGRIFQIFNGRKYRLSEITGSATSLVEHRINPNTNGVGLEFSIMGRIWDERFIER